MQQDEASGLDSPSRVASSGLRKRRMRAKGSSRSSRRLSSGKLSVGSAAWEEWEEREEREEWEGGAVSKQIVSSSSAASIAELLQ